MKTNSYAFLYKQLDAAFNMGFLKREVPGSIAQNLNPKYELRPYQGETPAEKSAVPRKSHTHPARKTKC